MGILTNMLQGICAYHSKKKIKKKSLPALPAKSQSDTPSTDIFPLGLVLPVSVCMSVHPSVYAENLICELNIFL